MLETNLKTNSEGRAEKECWTESKNKRWKPKMNVGEGAGKESCLKISAEDGRRN
jgi:hypothetical protein